jgi:hypothetical protein
MADDRDGEDRVTAFLDHLLHHDLERERFQHEVLSEIVKFAKREGYDFSAEDFKSTVSLEIRYLSRKLKWPPGRK